MYRPLHSVNSLDSITSLHNPLPERQCHVTSDFLQIFRDHIIKVFELKISVNFSVFDNKIPVGSIFPLFFLNVWLHRFCFLEVSPWEILLYSQKEISAKLWIVHMIPLFTLFWTKLKYYTNEFISKWRCKQADRHRICLNLLLCKTPTYFERIIL